MIAWAKAFWKDRTPREQMLLAIMTAVALGAAVHALVWQPLAAHRVTLLAQIDAHAAAERFLIQGGVVPDPALAPVDPAGDQPLAARLTQSASALGLTVRRLDPAADRGAEVTLEEAPFERVMAWMIELERDRNLVLRAFTLQRRPAPGVVAATVSVGE